MSTDDWYKAMAAALKKRDHAQAMLDRWQASRTEAEAEVEQLKQDQVVQVQEQAPEQE